jgi:D-sedoheptulose 7-phosphate isomerase
MKMADDLRAQLEEHQAVVAAAAVLLPSVDELAELIIAAVKGDGRLITFGNGGSAADAQHFAGELVGRYRSTRRPLPAIALSTDPSVLTSIGNDFGFDDLFARQVEAHARPGDVVVGITTSGRSENVVRGLRAARRQGATAVALTGAGGGPAAEAADLAIRVPSVNTARVQETCVLFIHLICERIDAWVRREGEGG